MCNAAGTHALEIHAPFCTYKYVRQMEYGTIRVCTWSNKPDMSVVAYAPTKLEAQCGG